jgi:hypothetical protein
MDTGELSHRRWSLVRVLSKICVLTESAVAATIGVRDGAGAKTGIISEVHMGHRIDN